VELNEMTLAQLIDHYNQHAEKPVKAFRDKQTAIGRILALTDGQPSSKLEESTVSPGYQRMAAALGTEGQEALRQKVLADQEAATAAVPNNRGETAAGAPVEPAAPSKGKATPQGAASKGSAPRGRGKRDMFVSTDVIRYKMVDREKLSKRLGVIFDFMKDGQTAGDYIEKHPNRDGRRDIRHALHRGMITVEPKS